MASWLLHLPARVPILGDIRFDLLLVLILIILIILGSKDQEIKGKQNDTGKSLKIMIVYIFLTIPFVQWPGSVIYWGLPSFIKAVVFYYFTINFVNSEDKLRKFIGTFLACQCFRVLEPVYLHITENYWGSGATMANFEVMQRLSGAPLDVVNPNGLAFIIVTVIIFLYFFSPLSWMNKTIFLLLMPILLYALVLTGSRSGLLGLIVVLLGIVLKSSKKLLLSIIIVGCGGLVFISLSPNHQDRYLSVFDSNTKNAQTVSGRLEGIKLDFNVALRRPFIGHGLGTSREANVNYRGVNQISHNQYSEVAQELGFVGLIIFLFFVKSIIVNFKESSLIINERTEKNSFLLAINDSMQVWLAMNILFSFASYGLSNYAWYLFAGLSIILKKVGDETYKLNRN